MRRVSAIVAAAKPSPVIAGVLCGAGAALFWALGFVAARHGIDIGFAPAELVLHRFIWAGIIFLPMMFQSGMTGLGWGRAGLLAFFSGPPLALLSYSGFLLVPLGHGGVIQPSCAALGGLTLAALVLKERLPLRRALGAVAIVGGLMVIGAEALATIGKQGVLGDLAFVAAGSFFAIFGMLLRLWRVAPMRGTAMTSVVSLVIVPIHWLILGFDGIIALGFWENFLQAMVQGLLAGPGAIYLFARAVVLLGAARAAVFPSLVPVFTLLIGFLVLGSVPSLFQLIGLAIVIVGFRLTQKA